jgi:hypothetical protein
VPCTPSDDVVGHRCFRYDFRLVGVGSNAKSAGRLVSTLLEGLWLKTWWPTSLAYMTRVSERQCRRFF